MVALTSEEGVVSQLVSIPPPVVPARPPAVQATGRTDVGRIREVNEDSHAVLPHLGLFMVADGMGGEACGDIASALVIEHVRRAFEDPDTTWPRSLAKPTPEIGLPLLVGGIKRANFLIANMTTLEGWRHGMGTTFAGILVLGDRVGIAHVGDSRVYRLRGRRLDQLTEDHSLTNEYIRAGLLDPRDAGTFAYRHVLSRAIDGTENVEVDARFDIALPGDLYLVCSDGLHGAVKDAMIAAVLLEEPDLGRAAARLVGLANDNGGEDNITVVLARMGASAR
jgi:protein phosphatase